MTTILGHNMTLLAIFDFWMTNVLQPAHSGSKRSTAEVRGRVGVRDGVGDGFRVRVRARLGLGLG